MVAPYCAATHCETGVSYVYTLFCRLPHETGGFRASRTRASLPSSLSRPITAIHWVLAASRAATCSP